MHSLLRPSAFYMGESRTSRCPLCPLDAEASRNGTDVESAAARAKQTWVLRRVHEEIERQVQAVDQAMRQLEDEMRDGLNARREEALLKELADEHPFFNLLYISHAPPCSGAQRFLSRSVTSGSASVMVSAESTAVGERCEIRRGEGGVGEVYTIRHRSKASRRGAGC